MTFTITFIITLTATVVITFILTFAIVKRKFEKFYNTAKQLPAQTAVYDTVNPPAIIKDDHDVKLEANPAYGTTDRVIMDDNPAYESCKL